MRFDIITIFPHIFDSYLQESMIKRAIKKKIIEIKIWNLRDFTTDRHKTVDDRPYGGGPGMVLKIEPIIKAIRKISQIKTKVKIILLSPAGKQFNSTTAANFAKRSSHIIFICGRYEGVDARLQSVLRTFNIQLQIISIGPYVLSGGELPALVMLETISRHIPDFLGKAESLEERRLGVGVPMYTRPEAYKKFKVPEVLLSGNHKKIEEWRKNHKK